MACSSWKRTKLLEVIELQRGYDLPSKERSEGSIPIVSSSGVSGFHNKAKVKAPGVITGRYGTIGKVFYTEHDFWPLNTTLFVKDFKGNNPRFISYFLRTIDFLKYSDKAAVPGINRNHLYEMDVIIPSVPEQHVIAEILSSLDNKIELNNRMNKTIEHISQTLFKRWFVDFEFPNQKGKPYKATGGKMVYNGTLGKYVPEGWQETKLGAVISFCRGVSYRSEDLKDSDVALVGLKSVARGGGFNIEGLKSYAGTDYKEEQVLNSGDLVIAHTDLTQNMEVLGKPALIRKTHKFKKMVASMDLGIIRPLEKATTAFFYYLIKADSFQNHIQGYANGTTVLHLSGKGVPEYTLLLPPKHLIEKFCTLTDNLLAKLELNYLQIETLTNLKDHLLPQLISGRLRLPFYKEP